MTYAMPATEGLTPVDSISSMPAMSYRFTRPGLRPLAFSGSELAMAMSFSPDLPYWYELNIYRTDTQQFALVIKLFHQSEAEHDRTKGWLFEGLPDLFDALEAYDAAQDVQVTTPPSETASPAELTYLALDLQARVGAQRAHFASLVGELFEELEAAGQPVG